MSEIISIEGLEREMEEVIMMMIATIRNPKKLVLYFTVLVVS